MDTLAGIAARLFAGGGGPGVNPELLHYPPDPRKTFVKRIMTSSGGDTVQIADGVVFRNGRGAGRALFVPQRLDWLDA